MSTNPKHFDTIVIGAGIIGSGCAYKIAKSGQKTLLLEQFTLGHVHGSSHGSSRIIRCTHGEPYILPFALDAFNEWEELEKIDKNSGKPLIIKNGMLTIDFNWKRTLEKSNILYSFGISHEIIYSGSLIQKRFSQIVNFDQKYSAIYEPGGGSLLANNCLEAIQRQFLALGEMAIIKDNEKVLSIIPINKQNEINLLEVGTNKDYYLSNNVVIATGGWLPNLLPNIKIFPHRVGVCFWRVKSRQQLFLPENLTAPNFVIMEENGQIFYSLPCIDYPNAIKLSLHGSLSNNHKCTLPISSMDEHISTDKTIIPDWKDISHYITKHFPDLDSSVPMVKCACVYNLTEDENFIVDRHPQINNLFIAGGFSGTGFKHALTIGKIISNWINNKPVEFDMSHFKINRTIKMKARI